MLKLCIFGDIHYIDKKPDWPVNRKLVEYAEELTTSLVDKINNEIKPDIVVNLGDMIQASSSKEIDKKNIIHMCNLFKDIQKPYYSLLGNHELKSVQHNKEILELLGYDSATFAVDVEDYHLVFVGTDINNLDEKYRTQYISDKDLEWLKFDLNKNKNKKIIIFSHFGIAEDSDIKKNFWCYSDDGENLMLRNREKLKELIKDKNVLAVFCGHQHWTKKLTENNVDYYMLGSLTENINMDGIPDGVYFEVEIEDDNVNVIEKHLGISDKRYQSYTRVNKITYEKLAKEYQKRKYEIGYDYWFKIYDDIELNKKRKLNALEIGAGPGRNIDILKKYRKGNDITVIDFSQNMCNIIKNKNPEIEIINNDILDVELPKEKYDLIQMLAFIHLFNINDAKIILDRVRKSLKKDGFVIIDTTVHNKEIEGFYAKTDYNSKLKRFRHKYTKESFERLLTDSGFSIYKSYSVMEKKRNKLWYELVLKRKI